VLLAYGFMTLFALPRALQHSGYLFHYCGHTCLRTLLVILFLKCAVYKTTSTISPSNAITGLRFHWYLLSAAN
jgi:hypothetical protein